MTREKAIRIISFNEVQKLNTDDRQLYLLNYWPLDQNDEDFYLLDNKIRLEMQDNDYPCSKLDDSRYDMLILLSLESSYVSYSNNELSELVSKIMNRKIIVVGENPIKYFCPCCGKKTLSMQGEYDICPNCGWEDDGNQDEDRYSNPNHMTLKQARANYSLYGKCVDKDKS